MRGLGLVTDITELGATKDMLDGILKSTLITDGGDLVMTEKYIRAVLEASY